MLTLYRRLIALRRQEAALHVGSYTPVVTQGSVLAYLREANGRRWLIALNLGSRPAQLPLTNIGAGRIVIATERRREKQLAEGRLVLTGDDGMVIELD